MANQNRLLHQLIVAALLIVYTRNVSGWFFSIDNSAEREKLRTEHASVSEPPVPFEMQTADDNFLLQAQYVAELSPLDLCHHMVIGEITTTCSDMSEEELNKLAVMLLNCQSRSENRPTYPCSTDMTIAECTANMDGTTWNAYQIVANRARAICYSTRQQHFRMKTEHSVNKLVMHTQKQAETVKKIQEQQEAVAEAAGKTLQQVTAGQQQLQQHQQQTMATQHQLHSSLSLNLRALYREKALIAAGNAEVAEMTQNLRKKLDDTSAKLDDQAEKQEKNHQHIVSDLSDIQTKANDVFNKIDESSKNVLELQSESEKHYKHTLDNLEKVNNTINYALNTLEEFKLNVERKINWLMALVGGTGDRMERVWTVVLHICYLLLAVISASFLQTPVFTRLVILLIVPLNACAQLHHLEGVTFLPMTLFIMMTLVLNWFVGFLGYLLSKQGYELPPAITAGAASSSHSNCITCTAAPTAAANTDSTDGAAAATAAAVDVASPEVQQLLKALEKCIDAGMLTPSNIRQMQARTARHRETGEGDGLPTPSYQPSVQSQEYRHETVQPQEDYNEANDSSFFADDLMPPPAATVNVRSPHAPSLASVRKQLLTATPKKHLGGLSLDNAQSLDASNLSIDHTPPLTPALTSSGPPSPSPSIRSRLTSHHKQCLAVTKSGLPCKKTAMENSGFCHCHQTTPERNTSISRASSVSQGTPRGTPRAKEVYSVRGTPIVTTSSRKKGSAASSASTSKVRNTDESFSDKLD